MQCLLRFLRQRRSGVSGACSIALRAYGCGGNFVEGLHGASSCQQGSVAPSTHIADSNCSTVQGHSVSFVSCTNAEALSAELARCTVMHQRTGVLQTSPHGASSCQQKPEGLHHTSRSVARLSLVHKFPQLFSRFGVRQSFFGYACRGAKPRCLVSPNIVAKWVSRRLGWCMGPASPRLACPPAPDAAQSSGTVFLSSPPNTMITPRPDPRHFGSACPLCTRRAQLLHDVAQWRWTWSHTRSLVSTQRWVARRRPSLVSTQRVFPQRARDPLGNIDSVACSHHTDEENMALTW